MNSIAFTKSRAETQYFAPKRDGLNMAKRIECVLPSIIHPDQTGFMKERYIGQNIQLINDIIQQTELQKIPGILLFLDFQKAFNTLEWSFIQHTLNLFNFGNGIKK